MKKHLILTIFIILAGICLAQTEGYIKGVITDTRNKPVNNVSVVIKELDLATHTDSTGSYLFKGVPEGEYTLWFSHFSYIDTKRTKVNVLAEKVTNVNMSLLPFEEERYINSRKKEGFKNKNSNSSTSDEGSGRLNGNVLDTFGNPIILADIRIMETNQTVQSDSFGKFLMTDINPGLYTVAFSKFGFEERRFIGIHVKPNQTTTKKVKLSFQK